ncbi:TrlF family AAA-like ATPase [Chloroflexota bacterium]
MPIVNEILNLCPGAVWLKMDLHIHTPASLDIGEESKKASPKDLVDIALSKQLDAIAITDHNSAYWCDKVSEAAKLTKLKVFPGVEISTHQGHMLGIFDINTPASKIEDLLIKAGIKREHFGKTEITAELGVVDICNLIEKYGGVAIAAHVDRPLGFIATISVGAERKRAYNAENLRALEITDASLRDKYQRGISLDYETKIACIQSSDCWDRQRNCHEFNSIATRYSLLKMDEPSLSGLKLALFDPEMRIRLSNDANPSPANAILGFWVTKGFLDGQKFRLSENVSCFIGDTGAGKSVAIELIRFGLNQLPSVKKINAEVSNLIRQQLGDLGTIHILLRKGDANYLVERTWGVSLVPPIVYRILPTGTEQITEEFDMRLFFPIKAFSQSEIIEFAREPEVRLSLTDDLIDYSSEYLTIKELKTDLFENASSIIAEEAKISNFKGRLEDLPTLKEDLAGILKVLDDPKIKQQQNWYKEKAIIEKATEQLFKLNENIESAMKSLGVDSPLPKDIKIYPNSDLMGELKTIYEEWEATISTCKTDLVNKVEIIALKVRQLKDNWDTRFQIAEEAYQKLLVTIDKNNLGFQALSAKMKILEQQIADLTSLQADLDKVNQHIAKLQEGREALLTKLQSNRKQITSKRGKKAEELSVKLDNRIRLKIHPRKNLKEYRNKIEQIAEGSRLYQEDFDLIIKCHPVPFVKLLLMKDFDTLKKNVGIGKTKLSKLLDTINERSRAQDLYDLQLTDTDDIVEVMLKEENGEYKSLEDLAHGQKCMVVLMVSLAEGEFPLIVDQPEDALHAPSIEGGIVTTLRSRRGVRQCIFATRNANILVSADAEQIFALEANALHGKLVSCGSLDKYDHRKLVIFHVEGGEEAFEKRIKKYTLRPSPKT